MEPNSTINLIYVSITAIGLLIPIIASFIKSNREAERFESWLKTHEKEITELKQTNQIETRRIEALMANMQITIGKIDTKLELLLSGRIKSTEINEKNQTNS